MPEEQVAKVRRLTRWRRIGVASLLVIGGLLLGGVVFVLSGVYNIAASREHWSATNFVITVLRDRSIAAAASGIEAPALDDPDLYRLGEQHVKWACSTCHGQPGEALNPLYASMSPSPPDLAGALEHYSVNEVFWIVDHGLKYTGMPAWPGASRPDEVWSVVAYLDRLYRSPSAGVDASEAIRDPQSITGCQRCHGSDELQPVSALVPRLQGLSEPYITRALGEYRSGSRSSGFMEPIAHGMSDDDVAAFAGYFSSLASTPILTEVSEDTLIAGREIAETGIASADVPACSSCHGGADPQVPELRGQSARYLATQLKLWRNGDHRVGSEYGRIMAVIGERLDEAQADAVAAYYASQVAPGERR